jgi:hypothetical protein
VACFVRDEPARACAELAAGAQHGILDPGERGMIVSEFGLGFEIINARLWMAMIMRSSA